jgi:thymidine kinase
MAKLMYKFGTMNSGKSIEILRTAHNYEEQGKSVMLFTSSKDDRSGIGNVSSRIGIKREAILVDFNMVEIVKNKMPDCVLVDEVQFLEPYQIELLTTIVDTLNIPVIAYGLMTDFQGNMFDGSKRLLELCDKIEEIKTVCWYCENKAKFNTRFKNGEAVFEGERIRIGGNESYLPLCRKCYNKLKIKKLEG